MKSPTRFGYPPFSPPPGFGKWGCLENQGFIIETKDKSKSPGKGKDISGPGGEFRECLPMENGRGPLRDCQKRTIFRS